MFKKTAIVAGLGLALSATAQADYRWELGAGYAAGSLDYETKNPKTIDDDNDTDIFDVSATWFMETVDTSKGPLGEAAFLDHASYISLAFSDGEIDISNADDEEPSDQEVDTWSLGVGKYLGQNTTLVLGYDNVSVNNGGDADRWGVELEHFFAFSGNGGIKARANGGKTVVNNVDDPTTWGVGATWYIGNHFGIGADYNTTDFDGYETDTYAVNAEWFITENFAIDVFYQDIQPDDADCRPAICGGQSTGQLETEYDEIGISALLRF
jgi:hypothetical protein